MFRYEPEVDDEATNKEGRLIHKQVEWVDLVIADGKTSVPKKVNDKIKEEYSEEYRAWKEGIEIPPTGTALVEWGLISRAEAEALVLIGVRTVEELAEMSDSVSGRIHNVPGLKQKAKVFLKNAGGAENVAKIADLTAKNDILEARIDELMNTVNELSKQNQTEPPKKRRGRPTKEKAA